MVQVVPSTNTTQVRARTTGTPSSVAVGSAQTYYEYSRDWAIKMDGMVQGVDYSSKYYANQSHEYADSILTNAGFIAVTESLTNINAVANNLDAINSVKNNMTAIDELYQYRYTIQGVYNDLSSIRAVASDISKINAVYSDLSNIDTLVSNRQLFIDVGSHLEDVETVSTHISDVSAVAYIKNAVTNVAGNSTRVTTVSNNIEDVRMCSGNISAIRTCASNISSIGAKVSKSGDTMTGQLVVDYSNGAGIVASSGTSAFLATALKYNQTTTVYGGIMGSMSPNSSTRNIGFTLGPSSNIQANMFSVYYDTQTGENYATAASGVKDTIASWSLPAYWQGTQNFPGTVYQADTPGWLFISVYGSFMNNAALYIGTTAQAVNDRLQGIWSSGDDINTNNKWTTTLIPMPKAMYYNLANDSFEGVLMYFFPCVT